jgi:hypothetical protein
MQQGPLVLTLFSFPGHAKESGEPAFRRPKPDSEYPVAIGASVQVCDGKGAVMFMGKVMDDPVNGAVTVRVVSVIQSHPAITAFAIASE